MSVLRLDTAAQVFHGGAEIGEVWHAGARLWAKPAAADPLAAHYGLGAGQITDYFSLRDAGGHTLTASGTDQVITRITNKGGSARHLTGVAASAPRFDDNAAQFRAGNVLDFPAELSITNTHLVIAAKLANPGANEIQPLLGHSGGASAGARAEVQYVRNSTQNRWRLLNLMSGQSTYLAGAPVGAWAILEMRYSWTSGNGTLRTRFNGGAVSGVLTLTNGGNLCVNRLGGALSKLHIGGLAIIAQDAGSISAPEAAVTAAKARLAQQFGVVLP